MTTYVGLLRGINVGGRNKVPMKDLREVVEGLGHTEVVTYIQSGNVVFDARSGAGKEEDVRDELEAAIHQRFGSSIPVVLRTHAELVKALKTNPYAAEADADGAKVFVLFVSRKPPAAAVQALDPNRSPGDEFTVKGREIYLSCPDGIGRSKLDPAFFKKVGADATVRNVNTVRKLIDLSDR